MSITPAECAVAWGCSGACCVDDMKITVDEVAEVIATKAATLDISTAMQPKSILIDVEVVRADGTREPIETIKGHLV